MNTEQIFEVVGHQIMGIFSCGSRVTCSPPVLDTDEDWMIRVSIEDIFSINLRLEDLGFTLGGSICMDDRTPEHPNLFWSYKRGSLNLLITSDLDFFNKFNVATKVSRDLNLLRKSDRIMLFQAMLYGNYKG